MAFESIDATAGEGRSRWEAAGRPVLPSLAVDGPITPILHVSQVASALGLPLPEGGDAAPLGWELATTLGRWLALIGRRTFVELTAPTESRGRSVRNLTVNVFHPVDLLPAAWESGRFDWDPDGDGGREAALGSAAEVVAYAEPIAGRWSAFLLETGDDLGAGVARVASPRGELSYAELLDSQAFHAAFHLAQIEAALPAGGTREELRQRLSR